MPFSSSKHHRAIRQHDNWRNPASQGIFGADDLGCALAIAGIWLFLIAYADQLLYRMVGIMIRQYVEISLHFVAAGLLCLGGLLSALSSSSRDELSKGGRQLLYAAGSGWVAWMVWGFARSNPTEHLFQDGLGYGAVFAMAAIGARDEFWPRLRPTITAACVLGFVVVLASSQFPRYTAIEFEKLTAGSMGVVEERGSVATLAYGISSVVNLWPLVLFLSAVYPKGSYTTLGWACGIAYLALQVWFQKRAPVGRAMLILFSAMRVRSHITGGGTGAVVLLVVGMGVVGVFAMSFTQGTVLTESFEALIGRYGVEDSSRFAQVGEMTGTFGPVDYVAGRGFGGWFQSANREYRFTEFQVSRTQMGQTGLHVGFANLLLKGGIGLVIIWLMFLWRLVRHWNDSWWLSVPWNRAAMNVALLYVLFMLVEAGPSVVNLHDSVLLGLCFGRGLRHDDAPHPMLNRR